MENQPSDSQVDGDPVVGERLIRDLLTFIGEDPNREGLRATPGRVVRSYKELFGGYAKDPKLILGTTFEAAGYNQIVICKDIEMFSMCEHHMIPFHGKVHIGYVPGARVVGLSKLARLVEVFARRLQIQEKLTQQIADTMEEVLKPKGVMVVIKAKHMCMCARGVSKQHSEMVTSAIKGVFDEGSARAEFMELIRS